ncbi:MAG TPA: pentapeptide repeat-containing protein [Methylotenera sp.]|nr:pentapeptide repeat-containing protein [Methylotenera sp.]
MKALRFIAIMVLAIFSTAVSAGEFGNNCTTSMAAGLIVPSDCSQNSVFEGKTYCFGTDKSKAAFDKAPNKKEIIAKAAVEYAKTQEVERVKITQEQALAEIKKPSCDLSNKDVGYLNFDGMDLRHCKMENISFFGSYLRGANLSGANLQRSYLNLARLEGTNLSNANLTDAIIFQAIFDKTNFKGANLTNARMIGTLGKVDMSGANVQKGKFGLDMGNQPMGQMKFDTVGADFSNTNFEGADLNIASFLFANLRGANLSHTNMYRAELGQADLTGANLTGANMTDALVDDANFANVIGLDSVKGFETVKGKCKNCDYKKK